MRQKSSPPETASERLVRDIRNDQEDIGARVLRGGRDGKRQSGNCAHRSDQRA